MEIISIYALAFFCFLAWICRAEPRRFVRDAGRAIVLHLRMRFPGDRE